MTASKYSILYSAEFILLTITISTLLFSLINVYEPKPSYVHQFGTLQESIDFTLTCNVTTRSHDFSKTESKIDNVNSTLATLPRCPIDKDRLRYFNDYDLTTWLSFQHIEWGGRFKPVGCSSIQRVAIIVPYRNRREHLYKFSLYIHQFLPDQLIDYSLYVIEQADNLPFNRAKLFNAGVAEVLKLDSSVCCFIFHDVDLLPLDQRNLYMCSARPKHLSPGVNTLRYRLLYPSMFGGVISMTKSQFESVEGFSNAFYGWGGEDDDIFRRVRAAGFEIDRAPEQYGVYIMLKHSKMEPNPSRFQLLSGAQEASARYNVESIVEYQLFTIISVKLG